LTRHDSLDVLITTPGCLNALLGSVGRSGEVDLSDWTRGRREPTSAEVDTAELSLEKVGCFVVDECDRMLGMGFYADILNVFRHLPKPKKHTTVLDENTQTMLFSATLVPQVHDFTRRLAPSHVLVDLNESMRLPDQLEHVVYSVTSRRKQALLLYLLRRHGSLKHHRVMVFCRTRQRCDALVEALQDAGITAAAIHKDRSHSQRSEALLDFERSEVQVLVATDMLSRGIDIPDLAYVVHYDIPPSSEEFVHRSGRTARAGNAGTAISFVAKDERVVKLGGRWVGIDEQHFMKEHERFLSKRLWPRKVAGPWRDEQVDASQDKDMQRHRRLAATAAASLVEQHSHEVARRHSNWFHSLGPDSKKAARHHARQARRGEGELPPLRNFAEGRYEDQVRRLQESQARRQGVRPQRGSKEQRRQRSSTRRADHLHNQRHQHRDGVARARERNHDGYDRQPVRGAGGRAAGGGGGRDFDRPRERRSAGFDRPRADRGGDFERRTDHRQQQRGGGARGGGRARGGL
jgi:superfamily II DNA/RNA helicase